MIDNSPRIELCEWVRLGREEDVVEYLAAREEDRDEGGECSTVSREAGSTLTVVELGRESWSRLL